MNETPQHHEQKVDTLQSQEQDYSTIQQLATDFIRESQTTPTTSELAARMIDLGYQEDTVHSALQDMLEGPLVSDADFHKQSVEAAKRGAEEFEAIQDFLVETMETISGPIAHDELVARIASLGYEYSLVDQALGELVAIGRIIMNGDELTLLKP